MKKTLCAIIAGISISSVTYATQKDACLYANRLGIHLSNRFQTLNRNYNSLLLNKIMNYVSGKGKNKGNYVIEMNRIKQTDMYLKIDIDTGTDKLGDETVNRSDDPAIKPSENKPSHYTLVFNIENNSGKIVHSSGVGFFVSLNPNDGYEIYGLSNLEGLIPRKCNNGGNYENKQKKDSR